MLLVLHSQIEEVETVAAACHILYSITHDDAIRGDHCVDIEAQLCKSFITDTCLELQREKTHVKACAATEKGGEETSLRTAVNALVMVLQWHAQRRDVTRACIRSITNLSHFSSILEMLGSLGIADPVLTAATLHPHARDIVESVVKTIKALAKAGDRAGPAGTDINGVRKLLPFSVSVTGIPGLLLCLKSRPSDFELAGIVFCTLATLVGCDHHAEHLTNELTVTSYADKDPLSFPDFSQSQYPEVLTPLDFLHR